MDSAARRYCLEFQVCTACSCLGLLGRSIFGGSWQKWQIPLAREYALRFRPAYSGGLFWLNAYGNDDSKGALDEVSRALRPPLPSRSRQRKKLRPAPLTRKKRRKPKKRGLRQRPTSTPPKRKPNWSKPSITSSRLTTIPITPPRNGSSTNPSSGIGLALADLKPFWFVIIEQRAGKGDGPKLSIT